MTSARLRILNIGKGATMIGGAASDRPIADESRDMKILFALFLCIMPNAAFACTVPSDCEAGSRCVKPGGGLYGVCRGGFAPGNANDKQPVRAPSVFDLNGTYGNTCRFDADCGLTSKCKIRRNGSLGTCVSG
jgi:hypothetical protein